MCSFFFKSIWCLDAFVCVCLDFFNKSTSRSCIFSVFTLLFLALWCICFHLGVFLNLFLFDIAEFLIYFLVEIYLILYIFSSHSLALSFLEHLFFVIRSHLTNFFSFIHKHTHAKRLISHTYKNIKLINLHKYYSFDIIIFHWDWYCVIHVLNMCVALQKENKIKRTRRKKVTIKMHNRN